MEEKVIEKDIRSNIITNDNRRKETDSAIDKDRKCSAMTQPDVHKPCDIKLPIGFFDSDKVRILYSQKNGASVILLYIMLLDLAAKSNRNRQLKALFGLGKKTALFTKVQARIKNARIDKFIRGDMKTLKELLHSQKSMESTIYIVQPAISKASTMSDEVGKILSAAAFYIKHTGRAKELKILGSP